MTRPPRRDASRLESRREGGTGGIAARGRVERASQIYDYFLKGGRVPSPECRRGPKSHQADYARGPKVNP